MTEERWLAGQNLTEMVQHLRLASFRKWRLFAVAAGRRHGPLPPGCVDVLGWVEQQADNAATAGQVQAALYQLRMHQAHMGDLDTGMVEVCTRAALLRQPSIRTLVAQARQLGPDARANTAVLIALLQCLFGNPFRPLDFAPTWRTPTATAIAAGAYADRAFDRLPILADALEDAGCNAAELLAHLRGSGPHARGCWALDAVLGKT